MIAKSGTFLPDMILQNSIVCIFILFIAVLVAIPLSNKGL